MDVSIIIVNYNTKELLRNCLLSIYEHTKDIKFEVIVSDNDSSDGSVDMIKNDFPQVVLIENDRNLGFGAANNRGQKIAKGKYILYLNSDTLLLNNAVKLFFDFWEKAEDQSIGALGANLEDNKGNIILSWEYFPSAKSEIKYCLLRVINYWCIKPLKKTNSNINKNNVKKYKVGDVDFICGADLFVKNNEMSIFDEDFFLYFEETNLQLQMAKKNLRRLLIEGPRIIHLQGGTNVKKTSLSFVEKDLSKSAKCMEVSRILYAKKNFSIFSTAVLKLLIWLYWSAPIFLFSKKRK